MENILTKFQSVDEMELFFADKSGVTKDLFVLLKQQIEENKILNTTVDTLIIDSLEVQ